MVKLNVYLCRSGQFRAGEPDRWRNTSTSPIPRGRPGCGVAATQCSVEMDGVLELGADRPVWRLPSRAAGGCWPA